MKRNIEKNIEKYKKKKTDKGKERLLRDIREAFNMGSINIKQYTDYLMQINGVDTLEKLEITTNTTGLYSVEDVVSRTGLFTNKKSKSANMNGDMDDMQKLIINSICKKSFIEQKEKDLLL